MEKVAVGVSKHQKAFLIEYKKQFATTYSELLRQLLTEFILSFGEVKAPAHQVMVPMAAYQYTQQITRTKTTQTLITSGNPQQETIQTIPVVGHGTNVKKEILESPLFQKIRKKGALEDWSYMFKVGETPIPVRKDY